MYSKFQGFLAENNIKKKDVAALIGVSESGLSQKFKGDVEFTLQQVRAICTEYGISADEYFFAEKVS